LFRPFKSKTVIALDAAPQNLNLHAPTLRYPIALDAHDARQRHLHAPAHRHHLQDLVVEARHRERVLRLRVVAPEVDAARIARYVQHHNTLHIM